MEQWNLEHRIFAYDCFVKNEESVIAVQREFRRRFNIHRNESVPCRNTILRWVNNFRTEGCIMKKKNHGPQHTVRTPENVERVMQAVVQSPTRSVRRHSVALGISDRTMRRILHQDLKFHPYKIAIVHKLNEGDYPQRLNFAKQMLALYEQNEDLEVILSDEAHFHLNGSVNKQNFRYWASENPRQLQENPLHSLKVTVWCAIGRFGVVGPYFFEENDITVTVTSQRYINMINNFFIPELQRRQLNFENLWYQQDGATAHTARTSIAVLRHWFPNRLISRFGDISWPSRSPDLSSCDFFLWGWLKARVYEDKPRTLLELKESIRQHIAQIDDDLLKRVDANFRTRLQHCINENGHHLLDIIFCA